MPDSFTHKFNGQNALRIAGYKPRNYLTFILGCNGPDPLFFHRVYNPFRKFSLDNLGNRMHEEKTGLFLQNLFRHAQTDSQKDYCLGFLCHYSLDSVMHPYVNYITTAYGSPFNISNGHGFFESSLDSIISHRQTGKWAAAPSEYCPDIKRMHLDQIVTLFKHAVEATYSDVSYNREEYLQAFKDFKMVKGWFYSPKGRKFILASLAEGALGLGHGHVRCHMQPCHMDISSSPVWRNEAMDFFCTATLSELLERANHMSSDYIKVGLNYFNGTYSTVELLEDIGNKSYSTGVTVD